MTLAEYPESPQGDLGALLGLSLADLQALREQLRLLGQVQGNNAALLGSATGHEALLLVEAALRARQGQLLEADEPEPAAPLAPLPPPRPDEPGQSIPEWLANLRARRDAVERANRILSTQRARTFATDLETEQARQRTPEEAAGPIADDIIAALDARIRELWGPLPWVRYSKPGRVLTVNRAARTCTVAFADDGAAGAVNPATARPVRFGLGVPTVGRTYIVHHPYRLPDEPTALLTGPVPAGLPWLKAISGATWLYYATPVTSSLSDVWRVEVPPVSVPGEPWVIETDVVAAVGTWPRSFERLFAGPLYTTDPISFAPSASRQVTPLVRPLGTNATVSTETDSLETAQHENYTIQPWTSGPLWQGVWAHLSVQHGTATTTVASHLDILKPLKVPYTNATPPYLSLPHNLDRYRIYDGIGFDCLTDSAWGTEGQFTALFTTGRAPDVSDPVPVVETGAGEYNTWYHNVWWPANQHRAVIYVSRNRAPATTHPISQPAGDCWDLRIRQAADGTFIGYGIWAATNTPPAFNQSERLLYVGRSATGAEWTWTRPAIAGSNTILAVNNDGSIALVDTDTNPLVATLGVTARYLTRDGGANWVPVLPFALPHLLPSTAPGLLIAALVDLP